jgi:hypothetical protein
MCCVVVAHARLRYARRYRQCLHMLGGLATRGGMQDASEERVAISGGGGLCQFGAAERWAEERKWEHAEPLSD